MTGKAIVWDVVAAKALHTVSGGYDSYQSGIARNHLVIGNGQQLSFFDLCTVMMMMMMMLLMTMLMT